MAATSVEQFARLATISGSTTYILDDRNSSLTGSSGAKLNKVWGVKVASGTAGNIAVANGGSLDLSTLITNEVYYIYPKSITVSAGTASLLS